MRHEHETIIEEAEVEMVSDSGPNRDLSFIGASILVGAILISASVFYNTKLITKRLDEVKTAPASAQQGAAVAAGQQGQQTAPQPSGPVTVTDRKDAPVIGNPNAKVTLYEFSDFQCPFCQKFYQETLPQIKSKYVDTGKVKIVYRHYPLSFHVNAQKAAEAGECANRQGKFEAYHNLLFTNGKSDGTGLAVDDLKKYAATAGLNTAKFNQCLDKGEAAATVKQDMDNANAIGVSGTPSFVIDSQKIVGAMPFSSFEQVIEAALKK